jgi:hypothetical protein
MMTEEVLYEDKYVKLTNSEISLKWYFFPAGTKVIPYSDIKSFGRAAQSGIGFWGIKSWGLHCPSFGDHLVRFRGTGTLGTS